MDVILIPAAGEFFEKGEKLPDGTVAEEAQVWADGSLWKKGLSDEDLAEFRLIRAEVGLYAKLGEDEITNEEFREQWSKLHPRAAFLPMTEKQKAHDEAIKSRRPSLRSKLADNKKESKVATKGAQSKGGRS